MLSRLAHGYGALLFADIIQAAGAIPIDVRAMGIDVAATSSYKWLFGIHGAGFLYVRDELQGTKLHDRLFPGHVRRNYRPWVAQPDSAATDFTFRACKEISDAFGSSRRPPGEARRPRIPRYLREEQRRQAGWIGGPNASLISLQALSAPTSAVRYQPGHVNYLGYAAVYEGLKFIEQAGGGGGHPEALHGIGRPAGRATRL